MKTRVKKIRLTTGDGKILIEEEISTKSSDIKDIDPIIEFLRVISSESRYKVMRQLAEKPSCFTEIHHSSGYSQKTVAQCLYDLVKMSAITRENGGYMLSTLGKIMLTQLKEMAEIMKKVRELEDLRVEFES
ncbi:MAG: hypothetical protein ABIH76_03075 [Candidatus Bathyarchaeota archaeon]